MYKSPHSHDLEGRDVQAPALNTTASNSNTAMRQGERGRILLSMVHNESTYYAAILLPGSYLVRRTYYEIRR